MAAKLSTIEIIILERDTLKIAAWASPTRTPIISRINLPRLLTCWYHFDFSLPWCPLSMCFSRICMCCSDGRTRAAATGPARLLLLLVVLALQLASSERTDRRFSNSFSIGSSLSSSGPSKCEDAIPKVQYAIAANAVTFKQKIIINWRIPTLISHTYRISGRILWTSRNWICEFQVVQNYR